jgi:hypothetical protein
VATNRRPIPHHYYLLWLPLLIPANLSHLKRDLYIVAPEE